MGRPYRLTQRKPISGRSVGPEHARSLEPFQAQTANRTMCIHSKEIEHTDIHTLRIWSMWKFCIRPEAFHAARPLACSMRIIWLKDRSSASSTSVDTRPCVNRDLRHWQHLLNGSATQIDCLYLDECDMNDRSLASVITTCDLMTIHLNFQSESTDPLRESSGCDHRPEQI